MGLLDFFFFFKLFIYIRFGIIVILIQEQELLVTNMFNKHQQ